MTKAKKRPNKAQYNKARHSKVPAKKERGGWLTAAIILIIIHGILLLGVAFGEHSFIKHLPNLPPTWFIASIAATAVADIVAGIALWMWKGWGFYLYLASIAVTIILGLLATGSMLFAFSAIIPFAIVGYIMRPKWPLFA